MASKMQNWIEYQRRHLSEADFSAWVAGSAQVQAFLDRQGKIPAAVRAIDDFQRKVLKEVIKPGLEVASEFLATVEKAGAINDRTGALRQAIGSTRARLYPATFCGWIASGPRRGYARAITSQVQSSGAVRLKRENAKFTASHPSFRKADPVKYAHILIKGRQAEVAGQSARGTTGKKALMDAFTGKFFGHRVKAAAPKNFMASAEAATDSAANMAECEMKLNLQKLLPGD